MSENDDSKTVVRTEHNKDNPYVMMDRSIFDNKKLSFKAKGLLGYLLSRPDNWRVIVGDLVNHATDGKESVRTAMDELKRHGYMRLEKRNNDQTGLFEWTYIVYEKPYTDYPDMVKPDMDNPLLLSNDKVNTESTNKKPKAQTAKPQNPPITPEPAIPSGEELLTTYFGEKAQAPEPRKAVDLRNPQDRADYADRLHEQRRAKATNEPWLALYEWVQTPRNGVTRDALRRVAHIFVTAGVPEPVSDSARKEWKSVLPNVYAEAGNEGTWEIIQAAAAEVAANLQYNPPHRWVQAIINIKAQKRRVSGVDDVAGRRGRLVSVAG